MAGNIIEKSECTSEDVAAIVGSIGHATYQWQMDTDELRWSANFAELIGFSEEVSRRFRVRRWSRIS